jgi:hypothetical protein
VNSAVHTPPQKIKIRSFCGDKLEPPVVLKTIAKVHTLVPIALLFSLFRVPYLFFFRLSDELQQADVATSNKAPGTSRRGRRRTWLVRLGFLRERSIDEVQSIGIRLVG